MSTGMQSVGLERNEHGHFAVGNTLRKGQPHPQAIQAAKLRQAMLDAVTPEDLGDVMRAMVREAKDGNVFAANLLLDRMVGKVKPAEPEQADQVAAQIAALYREWTDPTRPEDAEFRVLPK